MKTHKFDVEDANQYGVYKAIILEHLKFHQEANTGNPDMTFNDKPHAFIQKDTIEKMYSYMKYNSVRKWLKELEDEGVIESCKPFSKKGHHLKYYHVVGIDLTDQSNDLSDQSNDTTGQSNDLTGQSKNDLSDHSSIVTNVNIPYGGKSFKKRRNTVFWDKLYTRDEVLLAMDQKRIPYSEMENYFEMTNQKRGNLALWRPT